jgi:hypothetical protein
MVLALAEPSWVEMNGEKEKIAGTARLFVWTDSAFKELGVSPWKDRQQYAAAHVQVGTAK